MGEEVQQNGRTPEEKTPTNEQNNDHHHDDDVDVESAGSLCAPCATGYRVTVAILVRGLLLLHALIAVWLVVTLTQDVRLWALAAVNVLMLVDTVYTVVKRKGRESKWFCPCFLAYLLAVLPPVWLIELNRLQRFTDALQVSNAASASASNSTSQAGSVLTGVTIPVKLEPQLMVSLVEQTLLFLLVLCRWLLPRGDISRHELSQLLFVFLGIASDNMGLFELFDETPVRSDPVLTYVIMGVWSLSFAQFLFVLTATKAPQTVSVVHEQSQGSEGHRRAKAPGFLEVLFTTEIWSLLFSVMTQDGPYCAVRLYTVIKYDLITYSILFYVCKNFLVICLVLYRLVVILCTMANNDDDDDNSSSSSPSTPGSRRSVTNKDK